MNLLSHIIVSLSVALSSLFHPTLKLGDYNPSGGNTYRLQSSVSSSATSMTLTSFKEPISNIPYTMTYLNSSIEYGTLEPLNNSSKEFVSFTGIVQNSDGTARITGMTRGLGFSYPYTASTTLTNPHPGQAIFILSNPPQLTNQYANKNNRETISNVWTFGSTTLPIVDVSTALPTSDAQFATKKYVDTVTVNAGTLWLASGSGIYNSNAGNVGIGTTSPAFSKLSIAGNVQAWGNTYNHFGEVACRGTLQGFGDSLELCGNQNSDVLAPQIMVGNNSNGTAAYSGIELENDLGDFSFTHFAGAFYNSSKYTSTTFGTALAVPNLLIWQNTDGPLTFLSSTSTSNVDYIQFLVGGANTNNEMFRIATSGITFNGSGISYNFPSSQGASSTVWQNDGNGNLRWIKPPVSTLYSSQGQLSSNGTASSTMVALTLPANTLIGGNKIRIQTYINDNGGSNDHAVDIGNGTATSTLDYTANNNTSLDVTVSPLTLSSERVFGFRRGDSNTFALTAIASTTAFSTSGNIYIYVTGKAASGNVTADSVLVQLITP